MTTAHTIPLSGVQMALTAAKLRRYSKGRTALLGALTARPLIELDCHRRKPSAAQTDSAKSSGIVFDAGPLDRGYVAAVFERVLRCHGLYEVRRTFGCGIRALRAESPWILFGGMKGGAA